jgi:hypothetical protein
VAAVEKAVNEAEKSLIDAFMRIIAPIKLDGVVVGETARHV